jgi:hypothetical protein
MVSTADKGLETQHVPSRDDETIVADSTGHVTHSSGMTVDTHYAAQLRPSKLTGRGLTFMVSTVMWAVLIPGNICRWNRIYTLWIRPRSHVGSVDTPIVRGAVPPDGRRIRGI